MKLLPSLILICSMSLTTVNAKDFSITPDLVIVNSSIHTMDESQPTAAALAILGNRIVAIGATSDIRALASDKTRIIDGEGKTVFPGFNDAHVHWLTGGFSVTNVNLRDAKSMEELAQRLGDYARKLAPGRWIVGGDWDHEKWPGAPLPTRQIIDAVTPANPVFVNRLDGHMALANSLALKLAGVTRNTRDVPGGVIVKMPETGEPTGILKDAAMSLVEKLIPENSLE